MDQSDFYKNLTSHLLYTIRWNISMAQTSEPFTSKRLAFLFPFASNPSQNSDILINRRATHITNSCKFREVQFAADIRGIMPIESLRYIILCQFRSAYPNTFCLCVRHSRLYSFSYHAKFEFGKHTRHLDKGVWHRVKSALRAVHRYAPHDDEFNFLLLDNFDNFA